MNGEILSLVIGVIDFEKDQIKIDKPKMYHVVLLNDDYTPAEFVVYILTEVFALELQKATQVMFATYRNRKGIVGTYLKDIAESKVAKATKYSSKHQHPLKFDIEEVE